MSIKSDFLDVLKRNCGEWVCSRHNCGGMQPGATFREIKKMGYEFEEESIGRWAKNMFCPVCDRNTTHYKLLNVEPTREEHHRYHITPANRERVLSLLGTRDAFSDATISSTPEIDHKIPWIKLDGDFNIGEMTSEEIKDNFQILTREHNLLKDRRCRKCIENGNRPPFLGIKFWYSGDCKYKGTCVGCGWYDGVKWRNEINNKLESTNDG